MAFPDLSSSHDLSRSASRGPGNPCPELPGRSGAGLAHDRGVTECAADGAPPGAAIRCEAIRAVEQLRGRRSAVGGDGVGIGDLRPSASARCQDSDAGGSVPPWS